MSKRVTARQMKCVLHLYILKTNDNFSEWDVALMSNWFVLSPFCSAYPADMFYDVILCSKQKSITFTVAENNKILQAYTLWSTVDLIFDTLP